MKKTILALFAFAVLLGSVAPAHAARRHCHWHHHHRVCRIY